MKKFTLLLCMCLAAWCVPQRVWATLTPNWDGNSKTLTIQTTTAGELTRSAFTSYYDADTIVLIGYFNASDLEAIKAIDSGVAAGFNNVKKVDMRDAHFVKATNNTDNYQLFHTSGDVNGSTSRLIVGGSLYQWQKSKGWTQVTYPLPAEGTTVYDKDGIDVSTLSIGDYGKKPKESDAVKYLQLRVTNGSWTEQSLTPSSYENVNWTQCDLENHLSEYSNGESVRLKRYYRKEVINDSRHWNLVTSGSEPSNSLVGTWYVNGHIGNKANLDMGASECGLDVNYCVDGEYIWFYVYYKKSNYQWFFDSELTNKENDPWQPTYIDAGTMNLNDFNNSNTATNASDGSVVRFKWYFRKSESYSWNGPQCPTEQQLRDAPAVYNGVGVGADETDLKGYIGAVGGYIWFYKYYMKSDNRIWDNETTTAPGSYKVAGFDYLYRDNHLGDYADGQWVQMTEYDYYQVSLSGPEHWVPVDYSNGSVYSIHPDFRFSAGTDITSHNGSNTNQYGIVGGTIENENSTTPDYSQMKFDYWSGSIEKAVTSKYADTSISEGIFSGCTKLYKVEYLSGNVVGFKDHDKSHGYLSNLSVTIGKDVTQIDEAAFIRCDGLTTLTFANDYTQDEKDAASEYADDPSTAKPIYPKPLTIGNEAFESCFNLQEIVIPNRVTSIGNSAFKYAGNRDVTDNTANAVNYKPTYNFKVTFERRNHADVDKENPVSIDCDLPLTIGSGAFEQCYNIQKLSLPIRLESLGNGAFKNTKGLSTLEMRETSKKIYTPPTGHHLLETIPKEAFHGSHIKTLLIPSTVTRIVDNAFGSTNYLEKVYFQMQKDQKGDVLAEQKPLVIESGAFAYGDEGIIPNLQVYVDINPAERLIICEYSAFNYTQMEGQTDEKSERRGVLHFNKEYWDYYQGDWKLGLSFSQKNLNSFKDGYEDGDKCNGKYRGDASDINQSTGKYEYGEIGKEDGEYTPANGWQMFVGTSTGIDIIIPGGSFIRTYSTTTTYDIPKVVVNLEEKNLVKVYRITGFRDGYNSEIHDINSASDAAGAERSATATLVVNTSTNEPCYIPKETGLIMKGNVEDNTSYLTYLKERPSKEYEPEYPYHKAKDGNTNLLVPTRDGTTDGTTPVVVNPTEPYPIWRDNQETAQNYRIFGLANAAYGEISQYSFGRMKPNQTMPANRAYLKLPVDLFHWANESVGTAPTYSDAGSGSRIALLFDDEDNSEITGIKTKSFKTTSDGSYYTMQGVKVARPQGKGIFIHNGKKIIVK